MVQPYFSVTKIFYLVKTACDNIPFRWVNRTLMILFLTFIISSTSNRFRFCKLFGNNLSWVNFLLNSPLFDIH